ncbi:MAG: hypothetical protein ACTSU5_14390 [Promethearchaeota archaeon]
MKLAIIAWDQKIGGVLEAAYPPDFQLTESQCMNIYGLHRMRKTEPSIAHYKSEADGVNQVSIFSGFGKGGYGGTGGTTHVGVPEKVLSVALPIDWNSREYERVAVQLFSRVLVFKPTLSNPNGFADGLKKVARVIDKTGLQGDPRELSRYLAKELDGQLGFSTEQRALALEFETKFLYYWIADLEEDIEDLSLRPASAVMDDSQRYIEELKKKEETIAALTRQVVEFTTAGSEARVDQTLDEQLREKDEIIRQMQQDYIAIFSKLTEQLNQQQEEINSVSESTQAFVNDLNAALRDRIKENQELKAELELVKVKLSSLKHKYGED